jgi:catalase
MLAQVAEKGDKVDDPTVVWPDWKKVELSTLAITKAVADSRAAFMPGALVPGIEAAAPMIAARSAACIVSLSRRAQTP